MTTKTCTKCGENKPIDAFGKHNMAPDGIRSRCRICRREENKGKDTPQRAVTRILSRIDASGTCWRWTGEPTAGGHGTITISGRRWTAPRAVYTYLVRPIPERHNIRRGCATPMCVRPEHLKAVPRSAEAVARPVDNRVTTARLALADTASRTPFGTETYVDWRHRAACRGEDPELFFPVGNTGPALLQIGEAKAVCRRCPVMEQCLGWAVESGQDAGVWGGLSEDERRALKRRATRNRARVCA